VRLSALAHMLLWGGHSARGASSGRPLVSRGAATQPAAPALHGTVGQPPWPAQQTLARRTFRAANPPYVSTPRHEIVGRTPWSALRAPARRSLQTADPPHVSTPCRGIPPEARF